MYRVCVATRVRTFGVSFVGRYVLFRSVLYRRFYCILMINWRSSFFCLFVVVVLGGGGISNGSSSSLRINPCLISLLHTPVGELSGMGAELLLRFRTSEKDRPRYTIQTHGNCDMVLALLGPDDYTTQIRSVDRYI